MRTRKQTKKTSTQKRKKASKILYIGHCYYDQCCTLMCLFWFFFLFFFPSTYKCFLGIDSNYSDTNNSYKMFDKNSYIYIIFLGGIRFVLVKPESYHYWAWIRIITLLVYLICQFCMFIGPSMFNDFQDSISTNSDSIEDGNLLLSQSAQDSVNQLIGYAFSGIFVSCLSNILLCGMHCIPGALYVVLIFYFYKQLSISDYTVYSDERNEKLADDLDTLRQGDDEMAHVLANEVGSEINTSVLCNSRNDDAMLQLQKSEILMKKRNAREREFASNFCNFDGLCRCIISKPCKIAILCRMLVMIFIFQVLNSTIEALPVIILNQSFASPKLMVISFSWWIIPIILLLHCSFLTKRYISIVRHPWKYYYAQDDNNNDNNVNNRNLKKSLSDEDDIDMSNGEIMFIYCDDKCTINCFGSDSASAVSTNCAKVITPNAPTAVPTNPAQLVLSEAINNSINWFLGLMITFSIILVVLGFYDAKLRSYRKNELQKIFVF